MVTIAVLQYLETLSLPQSNEYLESVGSPYVLDVVNPANKMSLHYGNATTSVPVTQAVWATINLAGYACVIPAESIVPTVVGMYVTQPVCQFFIVTLHWTFVWVDYACSAPKVMQVNALCAIANGLWSWVRVWTSCKCYLRQKYCMLYRASAILLSYFTQVYDTFSKCIPIP